MKHKMPISNFMTPTPLDIGPTATLSDARRQMQECKVRHLPVRSEGKLLGILSERDLYVLSAFPEINFKTATAGFAMTRNIYLVTPNEPLSSVAKEMAKRRIGSALVVSEDGSLIGIFTEADALSALASIAESDSRIPISRSKLKHWRKWHHNYELRSR